MRRKEITGKIFPFLLTGTILSGCGTSGTADSQTTADTETAVSGTESSVGGTLFSEEGSGETAFSEEELFSDRDFDESYDAESSVEITLTGNTASCDSDMVEVSEGTVTIKGEGTYVLTGTLDEGTIIVDAGDSQKVQLVFNNASITAEHYAAVYVREADKVFLTFPEGTENSLSNGGSYTQTDENNVDGVIFSKSDLTLQGSGSLTVSGAGHGMVSKDSLVITGGVYEITAEDHGLSGKDSISIADGSFLITSGKDGIHAENKDDGTLGFLYIKGGVFDITSDGDGISSGSSLQIEGGEFRIEAGGGAENGEEKEAENGKMPGAGGPSQGERPRRGAAPEERPEGEGEQTFPEGRLTEEGGRTAPNTEDNMAAEEPVQETEEDSVSTKGIKAGDLLLINGGTFYINTADDGFHGVSISVNGGSFEVETGDDGFHGDEVLAVSGGTITISRSYEGMEGASVEITGGDISIVSRDDGINAAGGNGEQDFPGRGQEGTKDISDEGLSSSFSVLISGGNISVSASGDGIDSNGDLEISGGEVFISASDQEADSALDYDGECAITGGVLLAAGSSSMQKSLSSASQGVISVNLDQQTEGSVELWDGEEKILEWTPANSYSSVVISSPQILSDGVYTLKTGNEEQTIQMDGLNYGQDGGRSAGIQPRQDGRLRKPETTETEADSQQQEE